MNISKPNLLKFEISQKRGFNSYSTGVIGYADSEYDIINNVERSFVVYN